MAIRAVIFHDDAHWETLAAKTRYELPAYRAALDVDVMRLWLYRLDRSEDWYQQAFGCSLTEFADRNPGWPLRGWVGLLLEATVGAH